MATFTFHDVRVETDFDHGPIHELRTQAWCEVFAGKAPRVTFKVTTVLNGTLPFTVFNGEVRQMAGWFSVTVPVEWKGGAPFTRVKGKDNLDVVFMDKDGSFVDVQVGIITRHGRFFLTAQQIYKGLVVRTRQYEGGPVVHEFVPTDPVHAYPGCSYDGIWGPMATEVIKAAIEDHTSRKLSEVRSKIVAWHPPQVSSPKPGSDWRQGVVMYFNMITGTGRVQDVTNGRDFFVHFNDVLTEDAVPVLEPMSGVHFRIPSPEATKVKSIKAV